MLQPSARQADMQWATAQSLPFNALDVYYTLKFDLEDLGDGKEENDIVKVSPVGKGCFDTVIVLTGDNAETRGLLGTQIAQVKLVFHLPSKIKLSGLGKYLTPSHWPTLNGSPPQRSQHQTVSPMICPVFARLLIQMEPLSGLSSRFVTSVSH
ncbi:hypothetical protein Moror_7505, partial [Moniliophthora roreri MCA 2997]